MNSFSYNDNIRLFKEQAKKYYSMQSEIQHLNEEIIKINERMIGYHSPTWDKIGSSPSHHETDIIGLIQKKQELEKTICTLEARCDWVKKCIDHIESPYNRSIANMIYLGGYSINDISTEYELTPRHVFETTRQSIGNVLTEELMMELLLLEDK